MISQNPGRLIMLIKEKEMLCQRLNALVSRAKAVGDPEAFLLNKELQKQRRLGKQLLDIYNNNLTKQREESKQLLNLAKQQEESILRQLKDQILSYNYQGDKSDF